MSYNLNDHLCVDASQICAFSPDLCFPFIVIFSFLVDTFQIDAPHSLHVVMPPSQVVKSFSWEVLYLISPFVSVIGLSHCCNCKDLTSESSLTPFSPFALSLLPPCSVHQQVLWILIFSWYLSHVLLSYPHHHPGSGLYQRVTRLWLPVLSSPFLGHHKESCWTDFLRHFHHATPLLKTLLWLPILRSRREGGGKGGKEKSHSWHSKLFTIGPPQYSNINFLTLYLELSAADYFPNIILTFLSLPFYLSLFTYQNCIPFF